MKKHLTLLTLLSLMVLYGCTPANVLTEEERKTQNVATEAVATLLFDNELDELASYNVRKDGHVIIKFHQSVPEPTYTAIVDKLRATPGIPSVYAEQGGKEVCNPFKRPAR